MIETPRRTLRVLISAVLAGVLIFGLWEGKPIEASPMKGKKSQSARSKKKRSSSKARAKSGSKKKSRGSQSASRSHRRRSSASSRRRRNRRYVTPGMQIPPERVSEIQQALAKRGYFDREPNGKYDEATKSAMRKFQKDNKLTASGMPSAKTLKLLGLSRTQQDGSTAYPDARIATSNDRPQARETVKKKEPAASPKPMPDSDKP